MRGERYVALGLASVRSTWFAELARWSTSAALPLEFLKCVSVEELRARLGSGRAFSAVLVDASVPGLDRDLIERATDAGSAVVIVDDGRVARDWTALGAAAVLPGQFRRSDLLDVLTTHARLIGRGQDIEVAGGPRLATGSWRGRLVAVTGSGGTGASTIAAAVAQALGSDVRYAGLVLLADLALDADQAMLHDAGDVVPGLQELVEAHRAGEPSVQDIRSMTFAVPDRLYELLLGLRRHRDWTTIRPRAFAATLDNVRRSYKAVVADCSPDLEGEDECGSIDVEERNVMARHAIADADLVVIVGLPGPKGLHRLVRLAHAVVGHGAPPNGVLPVLNRAPRSPRARADAARAFAELTTTLTADRAVFPPLLPISERRHLDELIHDAAPLPPSIVAPVAAAVTALIDRTRATTSPWRAGEPVPVVPGSLGSYADDD